MKKRAPNEDSALGGNPHDLKKARLTRAKEAPSLAQASAADSEPLPDRIGGMLTADVLKRQKSGLMLRLAEQTRALADARERADQLAAERAQHTAAVAAVAQAWAELDSNLANFAARLAPLDSAPPASASLQQLLAALAGSPAAELQPADIAAELAARTQRSRHVLQAVAVALAQRGDAGQAQFETLSAQFVTVSKAYEACQQRMNALEAQRGTLQSRVDALESDLARARRELDRTRAQAGASAAAVASALPPRTDSSTPATLTPAMSIAAAPEGDEETLAKLRALERTVELLKEDNGKLWTERDALAAAAGQYGGYRSVPEEAVRSSPAFVSQQASLQFYQKEHAAFAATLQQLTAELNNTADNQKMEREKFRVWRKDFERSSRDAVAALKKELSLVRKERDDYRARLDSEGGAGGRERVVAETNTLLAAHRVRMAAAEAQLARVVAERDKALARIAELEPLIPQSPTSEARKFQEAVAHHKSELDELRAQLAVERARQDQLRADVGAAEERAREMSVVLGVWKRGAADKRELNEVRESEALLRHRNEELSAQLVASGAPEAAAAAAAQAAQAATAERAAVDALYRAELRRLSDALRVASDAGAAGAGAVEQLRRELRDTREETDAVLGEMGRIVAAFEELQKQNERLIEDLGRRNDTHSQLVQQRATSRQIEMLLREEKNQLVLKMSNIKKLAAAQKTQLTAQAEAIEAQDVAVAKLREENQNVSSLLEKERLALKETQKAAQEAKVKLEDAGAAAREAAKRLEAAQHEAWVQHSRCLALEGELGATRGGSTGGSRRHLDVQAEQLRQLKIAAACSVCNDRYKNTVLTTCFHTFCRECTNALVANRNRKCPRCAKPFDKVDVKTIFLDFEAE